MPALTDETKFSQTIQKGLNCIGLNYGLVVGNYMSRNTEYQLRMMDLIMAFLSRWASDYESGYVTEGERMYTLGKVASQMLKGVKDHHRA